MHKIAISPLKQDTITSWLQIRHKIVFGYFAMRRKKTIRECDRQTNGKPGQTNQDPSPHRTLLSVPESNCKWPCRPLRTHHISGQRDQLHESEVSTNLACLSEKGRTTITKHIYGLYKLHPHVESYLKVNSEQLIGHIQHGNFFADVKISSPEKKNILVGIMYLLQSDQLLSV